MNNLDKQYQELLRAITEYGVRKNDRTGTGTKSIFGYTIRHNMSEGFPLLTTKKMAWKSIVTELLWFLRGGTNIKFLVDNNCHIWDGDAYKNYLKVTKQEFLLNSAMSGHPNFNLSKEDFIEKIKTDARFAKEYGDIGPVYGKQWRQWQGWMTTSQGEMGSIWYDQISRVISQLRTEPDSRRMMVNAWNVAELDQMVLPPCHYGFQCWTRELSLDERAKLHPNPDMFYDIYGTFTIQDSIEDSNMTIEDREWLHGKLDEASIPKRAISLMWNQRSVDTFLGLPFNIASYGLLLMLLGKLVNMVPETLIGNLGDTHLYNDHLEQAQEQIGRSSFDLPSVKLDFDFTFRDGYLVAWDKIKLEDIVLKNYNSHPTIKAPLSN